ncbi:MAG: hypothetical protein HS109_03070 [Burkholderiales bacterium]|nr:hypothetical protein [Burkholderiales bacterium]
MSFLAALAYALLMSAIPLAEVVWSGRSPASLVLLFWFETVLGLVTGAIRIVVHRRATAKAGHHVPTGVVSDANAGAEEALRQLGGENTYLRHFLGITAVFTIAHGVFVLLLVFLFRIAGPLSSADAAVALGWATAVQVGFLLADLPRIASWSFAELGQVVGQTSIRVLVTQASLILGLPAAAVFGPWGLAGMLIGLRAFADAGIAWIGGLMKQPDLPAGMRRFLARRARQTEASLEAEFDALKEKGRDVETLLERPIAEVRAQHPAR